MPPPPPSHTPHSFLILLTLDVTPPHTNRKPSLEGRFSGRLPTKEDEKRLVDEVKALAPLLGGDGKVRGSNPGGHGHSCRACVFYFWLFLVCMGAWEARHSDQ